MPKIDLTPLPYFGVPTELVDSFLKEADEKKLKILLYILRHSPRTVTVEELCRAADCSSSAAELIVEYWKNSGILTTAPSATSAPGAKPDTKSKINAVEVAKAAETDESLAFLLKRSQELMGRTLTRSETEGLFSIYNWAHMPVDVLLMLIGYCVSVGKGSMRNIEKVAYDWHDAGIAGFEAAEAKINELRAADKAEIKIKSIVGITGRNLTSSEKEHLNRWISEWNISWELITVAFERTAENTGKASFSYMNGIIKKWHEQGIKKKKDLVNENKKTAKKPSNRSITDADIKAYEDWGRQKLKEASEK